MTYLLFYNPFDRFCNCLLYHLKVVILIILFFMEKLQKASPLTPVCLSYNVCSISKYPMQLIQSRWFSVFSAFQIRILLAERFTKLNRAIMIEYFNASCFFSSKFFFPSKRRKSWGLDLRNIETRRLNALSLVPLFFF